MRTDSRERGFSLIEVSVVLAVLGLLLVGLVSFQVLLDRQATSEEQSRQLVRAEESLLGFVYENHRLPCPASDEEGVEDCSAGGKGFLPWRTLGIPEESLGTMRYGAYRGNEADSDLARRIDRFEPLGVSPTGVPESLDLGEANLVDFCRALDREGRSTRESADADSLRVEGDAGARNVAYALALPGRHDADGDGNDYDGANGSDEPRFERPGAGANASNDDRVAAAGFESLHGYLSCQRGVSAIGHSHFNAAASARVMEITVKEYATLLELQRRKAEASAVSASAGVATAAGGLANAVAETSLGVAQAIGSYGALSPVVAAGVFAVVANTAATVTAGVQLGFAIDGVARAKEREDRVNLLVPDAEALAIDAENNAEDADARGF
ncbi:MAG: prepilin-type N-terminal cleavage/methylation domain-containing protein [Thioalkalivibrio sp.]|nr:prepilin-type N-terminal cleavage/methylation domain-containing protein [Thioalkalivibrio sp.]